MFTRWRVFASAVSSSSVVKVPFRSLYIGDRKSVSLSSKTFHAATYQKVAGEAHIITTMDLAFCHLMHVLT